MIGNSGTADEDVAALEVVLNTVDGHVDDLLADQIVPAQNAVTNEIERDVIGNKTDTVAGSSLVALVKTGTANNLTLHTPPGTDSIANSALRDVVGSKIDTVAGTSIISILKSIKSVVGALTDYVAVPFVLGSNTILAFLQTGYYHVHGASFIHPKYVDPIQLTSAVASWAQTGNKTEVIAANAITKAFDLHWISISDISATLYGIIDIFAGGVGSEVLIGSVDVVSTTTQSREHPMPVQIPQQPANTRISCRFSDSTSSSKTVKVKYYGHVYSETL